MQPKLATKKRTDDNLCMDLLWLKVPQWEKMGGLLHGFLGRKGGRSTGAYSSLNLSFRVGDDPRVVKDNVCDMKKAIGVHDLRIVTMKQVHADRIIDVHDRILKEAGEADGLATEEKDLFLGVLTADCVPILFVAPGRGIVAAVHAGWRGTLAGIAPKMVRHLNNRYSLKPESLQAALGPAIGPCCYEIGSNVSAPLSQRWGSLAENSIEVRDNKTFLDLKKLNMLLLYDSGVPNEKIFRVGPCTRCACEDFFSYRRERAETGRQISFIGWNASS